MRRVADIDHEHYHLINQIVNHFLYFTEGLRSEIILPLASAIPPNKLYERMIDLVRSLYHKTNRNFNLMLQDLLQDYEKLNFSEQKRELAGSALEAMMILKVSLSFKE